MQSSGYRVSPDLALEHFGDRSIVLLARQDRLLTINKPAAVLLELIVSTFAGRGFSDEELSSLLRQHYQDFTDARARAEVRRIVAAWLQQGILIALETQHM